MTDLTPALRNAALKFLKFAATHDATAEGPAKAMAVAATCMERDAAEIERLQAIEQAALRFVKEADESPRYLTVKTWATPEADPYLKLRAALGAPH